MAHPGPSDNITPTQIRNFGRFGDAVDVPPLTDVQTKSYDRFLQLEVPPEKRVAAGLEGVLREIFPIESYDKTLNWPRSTSSTSWASRGTTCPTNVGSCAITYGRPFKVWLRPRRSSRSRKESTSATCPS